MKGTRWIVFVVVLLAGNVAAVGALIAAASGDGGRRVIPDYYRRAAEWGRAMVVERASLDLGWQAKLAVRDDGMTVAVLDRDGLPVSGAVVRIQCHHRARADGMIEAVAVEAESGQYRITAGLPRPGLWDVDVQVHRGDVSWSRRLTVDREAR